MAPRRPDSALAVALSRPVRRLDPLLNGVTDAMNGSVAWLWWPLGVPTREARMPPGAHALYVVHALAGGWGLRVVGLRARPPLAVAAAAVGWILFTGAWDRRASA